MTPTCALLRAEFTKFLTVRSRMIALCAAAVTFVLLATLSALASRAPVRGIPVGPGGEVVSDTYMFVHQSLVGDGAMTARVAALSGAQSEPGLAPWAKAGIILEPGTNQGTSYAAVIVTGSHGVRVQYDYTHDSPGIAGELIAATDESKHPNCMARLLAVGAHLCLHPRWRKCSSPRSER